jgi:hypothetical protein
MIIGLSTYRSFEILRSVPPLRMTAIFLVVVGKRRRRSRLLFPSLFLATECHPERSEGSRQDLTFRIEKDSNSIELIYEGLTRIVD